MNVIEVKSTGISNVSGVLQKLVEHYSQSVHVVEETPPYFDSLLGHPVHLEPVVQYLLDTLIELPNGDGGDGIFDFINGYVTTIRPVLVKTSSKKHSCVPVLQNYEILLSQWMKQHVVASKKDTGTIPNSFNHEQVFHTIQVIASDVTLFTSTSEIQNISSYIRCNIVIPCLLRLLHHTISLLSSSLMYGGGGGFIVKSRGHDSSSIIRCVVSLLAFHTRTLDPRTIATSIPTLHKGYTDNQCACPPLDSKQYDAIDNLLSPLEESSSSSRIDWNDVCIHNMGWMDNVTGIASRTADGVWKVLARILHRQPVVDGEAKLCAVESSASIGDPGDETTDPNKGRGTGSSIRTVLMSLDALQLARAIREHFFGNDMELWEPETRELTQVVMGRRVTKTEPVAKEKPFIAIPSRVNVAIGFLRHGLNNVQKESVPASRDLFVQMMPIVFELLDAASAAHIALGTSSLMHLLDTLQPPSKECLQGFVEPAMAALDLDFTSRREGPLLLLIGQAQIRLLPLLNETNKRRRQLTKRWLSLLLQSSGRPTTVGLCLELLLGGIIPLLFQHSQQPNADAMELGRLGLSAILPLLENEFTNESVKAAALIALINLMIGAYPIMPEHGGKIMCHLLAFGASLSSPSVTTTTSTGEYKNIAVRQLCIHTGAVSLHICGEKFAGKVLDDLENVRDDYQEGMQIVVADIKREAKALGDV